METLGERLKACRERLRLTQDQVARAVGITRTMVSQWEHGRREPQVDTLVTLADLYGVTTDFLLKGPSSTTPNALPPLGAGTPLERWITLAEELSAALKQHEENERLREENERLRIERVDAPRAEADRLSQETLRALMQQVMGIAAGPEVSKSSSEDLAEDDGERR